MREGTRSPFIGEFGGGGYRTHFTKGSFLLGPSVSNSPHPPTPTLHRVRGCGCHEAREHRLRKGLSRCVYRPWPRCCHQRNFAFPLIGSGVGLNLVVRDRFFTRKRTNSSSQAVKGGGFEIRGLLGWFARGSEENSPRCNDATFGGVAINAIGWPRCVIAFELWFVSEGLGRGDAKAYNLESERGEATSSSVNNEGFLLSDGRQLFNIACPKAVLQLINLARNPSGIRGKRRWLKGEMRNIDQSVFSNLRIWGCLPSLSFLFPLSFSVERFRMQGRSHPPLPPLLSPLARVGFPSF